MITALTIAGAVAGAVLARAAYRIAGRRADWLLLACWIAAVVASLLLRGYGAAGRVAVGVTLGLAVVSLGHTAVERARRSWRGTRPVE